MKWWILALTAGAALPAHAAPPPADDLLEFLGSIDIAEDGWTDYLEQTDVSKVTNKPVAPSAKPAPPAPTKPAPTVAPPKAEGTRP